MKCQRCQSERVLQVTGKCSDCCGVSMGDSEMTGYVPGDLGIGVGDYIEFNLCLECGQLQGKFPRETATIEKDISDKQVRDFFNNYFSEGEYIEADSRCHMELVKWIEVDSPKLAYFLKDFFYFNTIQKIAHKYPSCDKFVQMYRDKKPHLGEDW